MTCHYFHWHKMNAAIDRCYECGKTGVEIHFDKLRCTCDPHVRVGELEAKNAALLDELEAARAVLDTATPDDRVFNVEHLDGTMRQRRYVSVDDASWLAWVARKEQP
jgi:hypothetical protein